MSNVKVVEVRFGDWGENGMRDMEWEYWNEWYGVKLGIDDCIEIEEYNDGEKRGWWEISKGVKVGYEGYYMNVSDGEFDEFGRMYFNIDEMLKMDIELKGKLEVFGNMMLRDEKGKEWEVMSGNGMYDEEMDWLVMGDGVYEEFRLMKKVDYEKLVYQLIQGEEKEIMIC